MPPKHTARLSCTRAFVLVGVIIVLGAGVSYLAVWVPGLAGPSRRAYLTRGLLHNIYQGLRDYDQANGHLPPAIATDAQNGQSSSWRIEVYQRSITLRTTDNSMEYDRHKAWNDPRNLRLEGRGAWLFRYTAIDACPPGKDMGKAGTYTTYYKAITGPGTAFESAKPPPLNGLPNDLILVVRVEQSDTHWMEPGDLKIEGLAPSNETKRLLAGKNGYAVVFADGKGWVLSNKLPITDLCKFFTIVGAKKFDRDKTLGPYRVLP